MALQAWRKLAWHFVSPPSSYIPSSQDSRLLGTLPSPHTLPFEVTPKPQSYLPRLKPQQIPSIFSSLIVTLPQISKSRRGRISKRGFRSARRHENETKS